MKVNVYSRAPKVGLYLNGNLIAERETSDIYTSTFVVPYQPGELIAVKILDGREGSSTVLKTVGQPAALRLTADRTKLHANGQDLSFVLIELVDQNGNLLYDSNRKVALSFKGQGGRLIASGSASPNDMESFGSLTPKLFNGCAMAIVRSDYKTGKMELAVTSEGLKGAAIQLQSN